ncbi:MAG: DNA-binding protein [Fusobacteria bacterium]|nr:MAG: DNA-binding protein [Fusobacteriota bacterium]KAF0230199.1 MAG: DNA-binding [Fusobacteriota bacterium]
MKIGNKLRTVRKAKNITLKDLANATNLSVSLLSNIERDVTSPTLVNFAAITEALNISITDFLAEKKINSKTLTKRSDFEQILKLKSGILYELATYGSKTYKCVCITIDEKCNDTETSLGLPEDNIVIVTEGTLELNLYDENFIAEKNDILFIPGHTPHSLKNAINEKCISYWFALQPLPENQLD